MKNNSELRKIPGVDILLKESRISKLIKGYGRELVVYAIRRRIECAREVLSNEKIKFDLDILITSIIELIEEISGSSLRPVINAAGIILHTNLGRAPLGPEVIKSISEIAEGYSNLEFNLKLGVRGKRDEHIVELIKYITGAEDAIVVNNNAAGIMLTLNTLSKRRETVVSRGELIEIGGSFRLPDVMSASGAKMVEVGTTNKTHLSDYEKVINPKTAIIFKAHKSNYSIQGFTKEVSIADLAKFAHKKGLPFVYDIGSGLLRKPKKLSLGNEPSVQDAISMGADIVTFSCDKLLGGPQAGIIAGKKNLIRKLAKVPMMRALRVGKLTLAALRRACIQCLNNDLSKNSVFSMLERKEKEIKQSATTLADKLKESGVNAKVIENIGQCGGGTLPDIKIKSYAVVFVPDCKKKTEKSQFAETIFKSLLNIKKPIVGILRKGEIMFDVLTIFDKDISYIAAEISKAVKNGARK